ncbi:predicted protein [Naegleria gruberi]|uniref:Predicted protein n=1 Tax=Naegleria gruberi TaxID=5762 RepID=D2W5H3_NAEGR|nr:uncharacterized protein NAEGRDRAFT_54798 [Naegleria gruberi]EFC35680.1 predicted protein [Naegleria gruberi]|eukprot:XP_002668424.1 predicted protein [Naegleria gruberi strain NEG-M]
MSTSTRNDRGCPEQIGKSSSRSNYTASIDEMATASKPHSSPHRSSSVPKRSSPFVEQQLSSSSNQRSSGNHRKSSSAKPVTPSPSEDHQLTYEEAVKKLDELSPKSKGILKSIMKTMSPSTINTNQNNNNTKNNIVTSTTTREQTREKQQPNREPSSSRTINNLNEIEKMATVNFANEPQSSSSRGVITGEEKPSLRRTVSSIPEVTKPKRTSSNRVVTLNVGGQIFQTTSKTLRGCESLFSLVFSEKDTVLRDDNGHVFIDRDPKYFRYM